MGGNINADLQNSLTRDWFALGIASRDHVSTYYIFFDGWDETNSPYLTIGYTLPLENWLTLNDSDTVNGTLNFGETADITVGFNSTDATDGTYNATIVFTSNDPDENPVNVPVTMEVRTPVISVDPISLSYGDVIIGSSSVKTFTIQNVGHGVLNGDITAPNCFNVTTTGKKNSLGARKMKSDRNVLTYTLGADQSDTFYLEFAPEAEQNYDDSVIITQNGEGGNTVISVTGNGIGVDIGVNPLSIDKTMFVDNISHEDLTISNTGNGTLSFDASFTLNSKLRSENDVYPNSMEYATGTCNSANFVLNSLMYCDYMEASWARFDISSIPDNATIMSVEFNGYVYDTHYPYWSITPISNDPLITDAATLYTDITDEKTAGYYSFNDESSNFGVGWHSYNLIGNCAADLQNSLSNDWFAVGLASRDASSTFYLRLEGWNETHKPYLTVTYAVQGSDWLFLNESFSFSGTATESAPSVIDVSFDTNGLSIGVHTATINISSNDPDEPLIDVPVTLHVINTLISPENVIISESDNQITLSWDDCGANSYKVYAAVSPNGTFVEVTADGSFQRNRDRVYWTVNLSSGDTKRFYQVTSSDELPVIVK